MSKGTKQSTVTTGPNPAYAQAMQELRRSSAAGRHTPKPQKGTRGAKQKRAIKESLNP